MKGVLGHIGWPLAEAAGGSGRGCSSGVEHNLAKVGVEGSNPFARSKISSENQLLATCLPKNASFIFGNGVHMVSTKTDAEFL
jgi:hypothetical protein